MRTTQAKIVVWLKLRGNFAQCSITALKPPNHYQKLRRFLVWFGRLQNHCAARWNRYSSSPYLSTFLLLYSSSIRSFIPLLIHRTLIIWCIHFAYWLSGHVLVNLLYNIRLLLIMHCFFIHFPVCILNQDTVWYSLHVPIQHWFWR